MSPWAPLGWTFCIEPISTERHFGRFGYPLGCDTSPKTSVSPQPIRQVGRRSCRHIFRVTTLWVAEVCSQVLFAYSLRSFLGLVPLEIEASVPRLQEDFVR